MKLQINKEDCVLILEDAISWIIVLAMYVYGFAKLIQFGETSQNHLPVSQLTGMQLMWAFYGYSKSFAVLLGLLEVLGGTLILFKRTRLLGCLFTSTILINIILQDIFYQVNVGALKAAILYQLFLLIILYLNRKKLIKSMKELLFPNANYPNKQIIIRLFFTFIVFVFLRILEYFFTAYSI